MRHLLVSLPSGQLTWKMENGPGLKMYSLLKMVIFHCHVGLPEGNRDPKIVVYEIIPISLGSISFPYKPSTTRGLFSLLL